MIRYAPAKINLALDILEKEQNGYHIIQSVYQTIKLVDSIEFQQLEAVRIGGKVKGGQFNIVFSGDEANLIDKAKNTVSQAINLVNDKLTFNYSYNINVIKQIPVGAGLGGGSSDAATVIAVLNELELMELTDDQMREIGVKIGSDVPLFIEEGTSIGTHYGEKIEILPKLTNLKGWEQRYKILVIPPTDKRKKTAERYNSVDVNLTGKNKEKTQALLQALTDNDPDKVIENMHNDFEIFAGEEFKRIKTILEEKEGALKALLCGSGTAVFAISNNPFDVEVLSRELPGQRILNLNQ